MDYLPAERFLTIARGLGVASDDRYPEPRILIHVNDAEQRRFWAAKGTPARLVRLIATVLDTLDTWQTAYLWPRDGWGHAAGGGRAADAVYGVMLRAAGARYDFDGAVAYTPAERPQLATALLAALCFGWSVADDLFVLPDHGRQLVGIDHHEAIHVSFASPAWIDSFVARMGAADFPLPDHVPDPTFKRPDWMK